MDCDVGADDLGMGYVLRPQGMALFLVWTQLGVKVVLEYWFGVCLPCICCLLQEEVAKRYLSYDRITETLRLMGWLFFGKRDSASLDQSSC